MTERKGIDIIQQGRIDFYIPLKIETSDSYEAVCLKISNLLGEEFKEHLNEIQSRLQDMCDEVQDKVYTEIHGKLSLKRSLNKLIRDRRRRDDSTVSRAHDGTSLEIAFTERGEEFRVNPGEMMAYDARCEELEFEYEQYRKIYGVGFVNSQKRYILWPLNVQLVNGEYVWFHAVLCIFENMMGVLKLELPLVNVPSQPLKDNNYDAYLRGVDDKWGLVPDDCELTIKNLRNMYIRRIVNKTGLTIIAQEGMLRNTIFAKYDGIPKQIQNIPVEVQEDLYRIIAAPVPNGGNTSYRQIAREYIENHSWGYYNMKYILSATGGCLSIVDLALVDWLNEYYKEHWKVDHLNDDDVVLIDKSIIRDLCINAEFAIIVPLLKFMNTAYIYGMKLIKPEDMHDFQMKYNLNLMFISKLQEFCYGSASEQVEAFERLMPYYLKEKIITEKMQSIDRILADEENQRYDKLQNFLSLTGLIMALVFGLPAIYDTFKIIRGICFFISYDIPILTIGNVSIAVWLILIVALVINILRTRKINRRKTLLF